MNTADDWLITTEAFSRSDITDELRRLTSPVLVLQARDYLLYKPADAARLTARMPDARLALIDGGGLFASAEQGLLAIDAFLRDLPQTGEAGVPRRERSVLSQREIEVLRLVALGRSNQQIADELVISLNTVKRHVANIFDKTGAANRAQAVGYARDHGLT
jgi:DNA-binding NarL/FixJ family response regulator